MEHILLQNLLLLLELVSDQGSFGSDLSEPVVKQCPVSDQNQAKFSSAFRFWLL